MASFVTGVDRLRSVQDSREAPGSMTRAMRAISPHTSALAPTHLRVGVAVNGRLERDEIVPPGGRFTLEHGGRALEIATHRAGQWEIALGPGVAGRISAGSEPARDVASLRGASVVLREGARGCIEVHGRTILFQLVEAPAPRVRPALPSVVRGGLLHQIDTAFTAVVLGSFMLHFGVVSVLQNTDWTVARSLAVLPPDAIEMLIEPLGPEPIAPVELPTDDRVASDDPPSTDAPDADGPSTPTPSPRRRTSPDVDPSRAAITALETVDLLLIGATGPGGVLEDVLAGGAALPNAADVLATVDAVAVASTSGPDFRDRTRGDRVGPAGDLGELALTSGADRPHDEGASVEEPGPHGTLHPPEPDDWTLTGTGEFDERVLMREIRARNARITRCYERALGTDPTLAGRVEVSLTVEESGTLSHLRVVENGTGSDAVARCLTSALSNVRVSPAPVGGTVAFRFPFVFAPAE